MAKFIKPPIEDDLLDSQHWQDAMGNITREYQNLSYWIQVVCVMALTIASLGLLVFSYFFLDELLFPRCYSHPFKAYWLTAAAIWAVGFVATLYYIRAGSTYAKIMLVILLIIALGVAGIYLSRHDLTYSRIRNMRMDEFILFSGIYSVGLLAVPAAYQGWKYARALKTPPIETEDWAWKNQTAQLGLKAWRLGALAFIVLGLAWGPIILKGLEYYSERIKYKPSLPTEEYMLEEAVEEVPEQFVPLPDEN